VNVVDSCGWLEYFADGPNADFFAPSIEDTENLLVPASSIYEVFKRVLQQRGEAAALEAVAMMQQAEVVPLTVPLSLLAAKLSVVHKLPMADSIILATARSHAAIVWTQGNDFENIDSVQYRAKA